MTQQCIAAPPHGIRRPHLRRVGIQAMIREPAMAHRTAVISLKGSVDLVQQVTIRLGIRLLGRMIQRANRRRLVLEQLRLPLGETRDQPGAQGAFIRGDPERVRHESQMRTRLLVFRDQAEQQPLLERVGEIQIADLRITLLPVPVDTAVALLEPVRVIRQIEMDQIEAALLQVQPLGQRVGADQDDAVPLPKALRNARALRFGIQAVDREHLSRNPIRRAQGAQRRQLAVGILGIDDDVRRRMLATDCPDLAHHRSEFRIVRFGRRTKSDQLIQRIQRRIGAAALRTRDRRKLHGAEAVQIGGHAVGFQVRGVAFSDGIENAKPQQAFAIRTQRPRPLLSQRLSFGLVCTQLAVAIGDDTQRVHAGGDGGARTLKQADKRQCIRVVPDPSGAPQPRRNQRGERLVECAHRLRCAAAGLHADRHHAAFAEQSLTGHRAADMRFEPPHDMPAIPSPDQPALPVNQAGIQQLDQRGEMCVVTVMRRRGQQQQSITASRDHFRQSPTQRVVAIRAGAGTDAMMRLVDDRQIPSWNVQAPRARVPAWRNPAT